MSRTRSIVKIAALGFLLQTVFGSEALAEGTADRGPDPMVTICHQPGTPGERTMAVNLNALQGHLGHGDLEGPCIRSLIDAHSQYDLEIRDQVIPLIDQGGISRIILSPRRREQNQGIAPPEDVVGLATEDPAGRIVPALRTKFGPYNAGLDKFTKYLEGQLGPLEKPLDHPYQAMAEVLMYHAEKGPGVLELIVHPDDPRVALALEYAKREGWPFVVHIEFAALLQKYPSLRAEFMHKLERLLKNNPEHPFAMIHMGQLAHNDVRSLIESHANIYFMTSNTNPVLAKEGQPWVMIFDGKRLAKEWEQLFIDHADRFILAFDNVFPKHWNEPDRYLDQIAVWRKALKWLPADVAEAVAHGNAERLWGLQPGE